MRENKTVVIVAAILGNGLGFLVLAGLVFALANILPIFTSSIVCQVFANVGALLILSLLSSVHTAVSLAGYDRGLCESGVFALIFYPSLLLVNFLPVFTNNLMWHIIANISALLLGGLVAWGLSWFLFMEPSLKNSPVLHERVLGDVKCFSDGKYEGLGVGGGYSLEAGSEMRGCNLKSCYFVSHYDDRLPWENLKVVDCEVDQQSFYSLVAAGAVVFQNLRLKGVDLSALTGLPAVKLIGNIKIDHNVRGFKAGIADITTQQCDSARRVLASELASKYKAYIPKISTAVIAIIAEYSLVV